MLIFGLVNEKTLYRLPSSMAPFFPEKDAELRELAVELIKSSAKLTEVYNR